MTDKNITDEMLKRRWMEWGCEEELVDHIIKRFKDMEIPEISFGSFYGYTYDNQNEFRWAMNSWKPSDEIFEVGSSNNEDDDSDEYIHSNVIDGVEIGFGTSTGRHQYRLHQIIQEAIDSCSK